MSTTGLSLFDRTLQSTNIWLDEISSEIGPDRAVAWKVLSTVLQALRDQLPVELAAHLGAQLPLLVRGVYYDRFDPTVLPASNRSDEEFMADIQDNLSDIRPVGAQDAIAAVFGVLSRHVSQGQIDKVRRSLRKNIRDMWPDVPGPANASAAK
ncbi:DUF2267 domain-containing protein [Alteraurantiacibacter aestuarii]|uniref:DUF2267 domain-containing protein n=1 Tax=Alteraurantiacibacter aestuarii TaxID=650004 RepID=UPI0031D80FE5